MNLDLWWGDVRFACRNAARRPAFTALVVITLALGIGAGSAVFALVDAVLLRSLPYRDPSRLVFVWQTLPSEHVLEVEATPFDFTAWQRARSFASLALVSAESVTVSARAGSAEPERIPAARVSSSLMPLLGLEPRVGRRFSPAEDRADAPPTAILSDGLWRRRFGGSRAALGSSILVNGVPHTIVGVMPPRTLLPGALAGNDDLWLPARFSPEERTNPISHNYTIVGRLADGVTTAAAGAEMTVLAKAIAAEHPDTHKGLGVRLVPLQEQTVGAIRPALFVLLAGVVLLIAIACANAATLLLAQTAQRQQELALRSAIGATSLRLLALALAESLLLALLSGAAGLMFGAWTLRLLLPVFAGALPPGVDAAIDQRAAFAVLALSVTIGVAFALMVAAHRPEQRLLERLQSGVRMTGSARATRTRNVLVATQIALAVVLLASGGLMLRSFARLQHVTPGFDTDHLLTFRLALPDDSYRSAGERTRFAAELTARLRALPGVETAFVNSRLPFGGSRGADGIAIEGRPAAPGDMLVVDQRETTPEYFRGMHIRLRQGREFAATDDARGEPVAIVNRAMAERVLAGWRCAQSPRPCDGRRRRERLAADYRRGGGRAAHQPRSHSRARAVPAVRADAVADLQRRAADGWRPDGRRRVGARRCPDAGPQPPCVRRPYDGGSRRFVDRTDTRDCIAAAGHGAARSGTRGDRDLWFDLVLRGAASGRNRGADCARRNPDLRSASRARTCARAVRDWRGGGHGDRAGVDAAPRHDAVRDPNDGSRDVRRRDRRAAGDDRRRQHRPRTARHAGGSAYGASGRLTSRYAPLACSRSRKKSTA